MTRADFTKCLAVLTASTGHAFTTEQAAVWFELLGDLDLDAFQAAVRRVLLDREYPGLPPLGLIRRFATEATHGIGMTAEEAFRCVRQALSKHGWYEMGQMTAFVGPEIASVVRGIGGWERICESTEPGILIAQFRDAWNRQEERRSQLARLPEHLRPPLGISEGQSAHPAVRRLADSIEDRTA